MEEGKISTKGQIVIPKYIRDHLGLTVGSTLFIKQVGNKIVLVPRPSDPVDRLAQAGSEIRLRNIRRKIKDE